MTASLRTFSMALIALVLTATLSFAEDAPANKGVTGTWKWQQQGRNGAVDITLKLKQEGDKVTGTLSGMGNQEQEITDGVVKGSEVTFKVVRDMNGQKMTTTYTCSIDGDSIKGKSETVTTREIDGKRSND